MTTVAALYVEDVRQWGGVLEHPAYSSAWPAYDLPRPTWHEGWTASLMDGGYVAYVEQGRYGLPVKKATWLYAYGVDLPELRWGFTPDSAGERPNGPWGGIDGWRDSWTTKASGATSTTPPAFRDVLLSMARSATLERCPTSRGCGPKSASDWRNGASILNAASKPA